MQKAMTERIIGLDILKTMAVVFVIVLHVNGYCVEQVGGLNNYPFASKVVYFLLEAIAYPAIHLFVLISSWFLAGKNSTTKSFVKTWSQTWTVTIIGLLIALALIPYEIKIGGCCNAFFHSHKELTGLSLIISSWFCWHLSFHHSL